MFTAFIGFTSLPRLDRFTMSYTPRKTCQLLSPLTRWLSCHCGSKRVLISGSFSSLHRTIWFSGHSYVSELTWNDWVDPDHQNNSATFKALLLATWRLFGYGDGVGSILNGLSSQSCLLSPSFMRAWQHIFHRMITRMPIVSNRHDMQKHNVMGYLHCTHLTGYIHMYSVMWQTH